MNRFTIVMNIRITTLQNFHTNIGESKDADLIAAGEFADKFSEAAKDFEPENIFNADELGLWYKLLPSKTLAQLEDECKGGKSSKERLTVLLGGSMTGEKLKPLVIGRALHPRAFKNVNLENLPVQWTANKNAWMTSQIFRDWLTSVNETMRRSKRHILLFVDNCSPNFVH